jgi:hypothetical protein
MTIIAPILETAQRKAQRKKGGPTMAGTARQSEDAKKDRLAAVLPKSNQVF